MGEKFRLMKGNEAIAEAALRAGCRFYAGYPITPQSEILETIGRVNSMSLAELNREIKVNKASLSRLVYTLVQNGYLAKNEKSGEFSLTLKTYEVGLNAVQNLDKLSLIKSTLVDLNSRCGRIAQFSVEDNNQLL